MPAGFDGFHAVPASVSKTCLVRFDNNKYSVAASAVGRPVEVHAYGDRIVIRLSGPVGDRVGKYRMIAIATALCAVLVFACGLASSLPLLLAARMKRPLSRKYRIQRWSLAQQKNQQASPSPDEADATGNFTLNRVG